MLLLFLFFSFGLYVSLFYVAAVLLHPHTSTGTHMYENANAAVFVAKPVARAIQTVCSSFAVCSPVHCSRCALSALGTCTLNERRCLTEPNPCEKYQQNWTGNSFDGVSSSSSSCGRTSNSYCTHAKFARARERNWLWAEHWDKPSTGWE